MTDIIGNQFTFVDWRPVPSIPIQKKILRDQEWDKFEVSDDFSARFRYCALNDGIIVFQIKTKDAQPPTSILHVARQISFEIKERTKHCHLLHRSGRATNRDEFRLSPVLVEDPFSDQFVNHYKERHCIQDDTWTEKSSLAEVCLDSRYLSEVRALKRSTGSVTDEKGLLVTKKLYNKIFDRTCSMVKSIDEHAGFWRTDLIRQSEIGKLLIFGVPALGGFSLYITAAIGLSGTLITKFLVVSIPIILIFLLSVHYYYNVMEHIFRKIRLLKKAICYFYHANTLSRVLWEIYDKSQNYSPENEYNPTIGIFQSLIDGCSRRLKIYDYFVGLVIGVMGLIITVAIFLLSQRP